MNPITPLELLNLYYSDGQSLGNRENKLWQKMNSLLSWDNILNKGYQADLCPLLYYILTKWLPAHSAKRSAVSNPTNSMNPMNPMNPTKLPNEEILSELKQHYYDSLKRNLILLGELKRVVQKLKENDIKVIVLKGAYLAENVYENIACRPMGDIDILVREIDCDKSYRILQSMGYRNVPENSRIRMLHRSLYKELIGEPIKVEIHHGLVKEVFMTNFELDEIFFHGAISLEFQIVYLSWHSVYHGFARILWLCDLAELIKKNVGSMKWDIVQRKSADFNIQKQLLLCKHLVDSILMIGLLNRNTKNDEIGHSMRIFSEAMFLKIQNKFKEGQDARELRHLLGMCLMKKKDLMAFIPKYVRYKVELN